LDFTRRLEDAIEPDAPSTSGSESESGSDIMVDEPELPHLFTTIPCLSVLSRANSRLTATHQDWVSSQFKPKHCRPPGSSTYHSYTPSISLTSERIKVTIIRGVKRKTKVEDEQDVSLRIHGYGYIIASCGCWIGIE
jgi:hypothetical protein